MAEQWQHEQVELIEKAIVDQRAAFPEVQVRVYVRHEDPAHALVRASCGADRLLLLRPRAGAGPTISAGWPGPSSAMLGARSRCRALTTWLTSTPLEVRSKRSFRDPDGAVLAYHGRLPDAMFRCTTDSWRESAGQMTIVSAATAGTAGRGELRQMFRAGEGGRR